MMVSQHLAKSVHQRLLNRAKKEQRSFNELLQYYSMERFLYRLSQSEYSSQFILKGALLLRVWRTSEYRSTMDIDMLGMTDNNTPDLIEKMKEIMLLDVEDDGLVFLPESIATEQIIEHAHYSGVRIRFKCLLGNAQITVQIDIGFGDVIFPAPIRAELPCLLHFSAPKLLCYSKESAIAEKFHAMVQLGSLNSRMKDFYDVWLLSRHYDFNENDLAEAIRLTFKNKKTSLSVKIEAFEEDFIIAKQIQWNSFCKRINQDFVPLSFRDVVQSIYVFLKPAISIAAHRNKQP